MIWHSQPHCTQKISHSLATIIFGSSPFHLKVSDNPFLFLNEYYIVHLSFSFIGYGATKGVISIIQLISTKVHPCLLLFICSFHQSIIHLLVFHVVLLFLKIANHYKMFQKIITTINWISCLIVIKLTMIIWILFAIFSIHGNNNLLKYFNKI